MRITTKLIEEIVTEVAGEDTVPLIMAIKDKKNVSEFKIAEILKEQINITRNMLYRLLDQNLVHFIRKKDRQKGWYIYYWTFNIKQIRFLTIKLQKERLVKLQERLQREKEGHFFVCPNGCMRLDFEHAINFEFKCPECGVIVQQQDNSESIKKIEKKIVEIEDFLKVETARPVIPVRPVGKEKKVKVKVKKKNAAKKKAVKKVKKKATKKKPKKKPKKKAAKKKPKTKKKIVKEKPKKKPKIKKKKTKVKKKVKKRAKKTPAKKRKPKKIVAPKKTTKKSKPKKKKTPSKKTKQKPAKKKRRNLKSYY